MASSDEDDKQVVDLATSARRGDLVEVQRIVEDWSSPESLLESVQTALWKAVRGGQVPVASYLLKHGAKFDSDISGSALTCNTSEDMFQLALDHGWDINSKTDVGLPILAYVVFPPKRTLQVRV